MKIFSIILFAIYFVSFAGVIFSAEDKSLFYFDVFYWTQRITVFIGILLGAYLFIKDKEKYSYSDNRRRLITLIVGLDGAFGLIVTRVIFKDPPFKWVRNVTKW